MKIKATIGSEHYKTTVRSETNLLIADEQIDKGGTGEGFDPHELLSASLASCTSMTLRMYADKKQWDVSEINVSININSSSSQLTSIDREIELKGNLSQEQKDRLLQIANLCPIHKILSNPIQINTIIK